MFLTPTTTTTTPRSHRLVGDLVLQGNLGIGTSDPVYALDIVGDVNITGTLRQGGVAVGSSPSTGTGSFTTSGSNVYVASSYVGIGTSAPQAPLQVSGQNGNNLSIIADHGISTYSDERLKTEIRVIGDALSKLGGISGYTYRRKDTRNRQAGVLAQEVLAVLPEVVNTHEDGMMSVTYGNMIALLIQAIKELNVKVDALASAKASATASAKASATPRAK